VVEFIINGKPQQKEKKNLDENEKTFIIKKYIYNDIIKIRLIQ